MGVQTDDDKWKTMRITSGWCFLCLNHTTTEKSSWNTRGLLWFSLFVYVVVACIVLLRILFVCSLCDNKRDLRQHSWDLAANDQSWHGGKGQGGKYAASYLWPTQWHCCLWDTWCYNKSKRTMNWMLKGVSSFLFSIFVYFLSSRSSWCACSLCSWVPNYCCLVLVLYVCHK